MKGPGHGSGPGTGATFETDERGASDTGQPPCTPSAAACLSEIELIRVLWWDDVLLDFSTGAPSRTGNLLMALEEPPGVDREHDGASLAGAQTIPLPPTAAGDKPMPVSGMDGLDFFFPACLTATPPSRLGTVSAVGNHEVVPTDPPRHKDLFHRAAMKVLPLPSQPKTTKSPRPAVTLFSPPPLSTLSFQPGLKGHPRFSPGQSDSRAPPWVSNALTPFFFFFFFFFALDQTPAALPMHHPAHQYQRYPRAKLDRTRCR
mgnify:CR=1 FL=1